MRTVFYTTRTHFWPLRWRVSRGPFVGGAFVAVALLACSAEKNASTPTEPNSAPYMAGRVTAITQTGANFGTVRVETVPGTASNGPKAVATVDAVTLVLGRDGKRGDFRTLAAGQWVRVWFDGAILQTYPVQGFANAIKIDSLGVTPANPTSSATPNGR